ncbi:MAG: hypothetical protein WKF97_25970 [Chitinophagaceae bacterium]
MNEHYFVRIDQYLKGEMSREEQLFFQSELETNEELAAAFRIYQAIEEEMGNKNRHAEGEAALKISLEKLNERYFRNDAVQPIPEHHIIKRMAVWKIMGIAAALIGLVALGVTFYLQNQKNDSPVVVENKTDNVEDSSLATEGITPTDSIPSSGIAHQAQDSPNVSGIRSNYRIENKKREALYAANFKPDAAPEDQSGPLEEAFAHYESGEYKDYIEAAGQVDPALTSRGVTLTPFYTDYYKAQSYMAIDNVSKAIPELRKSISKSPDSLWKAKVQWYLALAYLKTDQVKKASDLLGQLARNNQAGGYRARSAQLQKQLN